MAEPDLVLQSEYFYERSVGCVGVLKDWLTRALATVLEGGQETITMAVLEQQALPMRKLLSMAREVREGEETLAANNNSRAELRSLLGISMESAEHIATVPREKWANEIQCAI